jgi:hypothetical protein
VLCKLIWRQRQDAKSSFKTAPTVGFNVQALDAIKLYTHRNPILSPSC